MGKYPYVLDIPDDKERFRNQTWQSIKTVDNDFSL